MLQEAKTASALNHPNIITIHGFETAGSIDFLVMEYVDGETLDHVIPKKGLPLERALRCAIQIADALTAAHGAGIVHRDLKPANIIVRPSGAVKLVDFGIAKLREPATIDETAATLTSQAAPPTVAGTILGTASYMSPEQAEGTPVDTRSDVFSFGCVLYEMLTGQRAFQGESPISTLSAVLRAEPKPIRELARDVPPELERLITRCLRKDPDRRFQHMSDLTVALQELRDESHSATLSRPPIAAPRRSRARLWVTVGVLAIPLAVAGSWALRRHLVPAEKRLETIPFTSYEGFEDQPSFSPDGKQIVFIWKDDIFVRVIGAGEAVALTNTPQREMSPVWSPDGRWIAFIRQIGENHEAVLRMPAIGGSERKLKDLSNDGAWEGWAKGSTEIRFPVRNITGFSGSQISWSSDGHWIVYSDYDPSTRATGLSLLSVDSGEARRLTTPAPSEFDVPGAFSPDGRHLAFMRARGTIFASDIYILAFDGAFNPSSGPARLTSDGLQNFHPVWTGDGEHVVFSSTKHGRQMLWKTAPRTGAAPVALEFAGEATQPATSGNRLAYVTLTNDVNVWRHPVTGQSAPQRLIASTRVDVTAQYSPDGKRIAFCSDRSGNLEVWIATADGSGVEQLTSFGEGNACSPRWSPDAQRVAFDSNATGQIQVYVVSADGGRPQQLTDTPAQNALPSWSRDGNWIYFESVRTGRSEIWKTAFTGGQAVQVTRNGGHVAFDSADGRTLYYTKAEHGEIWQMPLNGGTESRITAPILLRNFSPAVRGIYFMKNEERGASIHLLEFATGRVQTIGSTRLPPGNGLSVSPDEQWVIYSQFEQTGSDIVLVENFR